MAAPSAAPGASLQNYNNELVKCLEDLRERRDALNRSIAKEEKQKSEVQKKIFALTEQLHKINDSLAQKVAARNDYDSTIQETEAAYMKILESSQTLLHVLKRETVNLSQRKPFGSPVRGPSDDRSQYMAGQGQMHSQLGHRLLHEDS